jgi:hypothetical protein
VTVGAILTLGLGTFSDVNHVVTLGYGTGATATPTPTPTVTQAGGSGRYGREKRSLFVLPDSTVIYATYDEVVALVQASAEPAEPKAPRKGLQKKQTAIRIVSKGPIPQGAIRIKNAGEKQKVSLPNTYRWKPDPVFYAAALRKIQEQEEEEIVMMLALH